jgi:SulP family sulfate permease
VAERAVAVGANPGSALWITVLVSSLFTGGVLYLLGRFRASRFIRFIPYPVVGGFLAGTGWLLVTGAYRVMTDIPLSGAGAAQVFSSPTTLIWVAGALYALVLFLATRWSRHYLVLPCLVAAGAGIAYLFLLGSGMDLVGAREMGWLFDTPPSGTLWAPWADLKPSREVFGWIAGEAGGFLALALVLAITLLLSATALEIKTGWDSDLDRELSVNGWGNLLAGMAGGMPGCLSINRTLLSHQVGARSRLAGILVAAVCAAVVGFQWPVLMYTPKPLLGGILVYLGMGLLYEWLFEHRRRLSKVDYGLVVLILVVVGTFGFLQGVLLGVVVAAVSFAVNYSRVHVIKHALTGAQHRSHVERSPEEEAWLRELGGEIHIFWLQGYLFFGTAHRLVDEVKQVFHKSTGQRPKWLILDFSRVMGMDSSAALSFAKLRQLAKRNGVAILCSRAAPELEFKLQEDVPDGVSLTSFPDVDRAMEWCEDHLLALRVPGPGSAQSLAEFVARHFKDEAAAAVFLAALEVREVPAGTRLCEEGEPATVLFLVESGRVSVVTVTANGKERRLRSMGAGTVVGEMGLILGGTRSAAVVADVPSRIYELSEARLEELTAEHPEVTAVFQQYLLRLLARRLVLANGEIRALLE